MRNKILIIGIGTGRCGSLSLAKLLNLQPDTEVSHEHAPVLNWDFSQYQIDLKLKALFSREATVVGDVSMAWLHYVPYLLHDIAPEVKDLKIIGMVRDKRAFMSSWVKWVQGRNQFNTREGFGKHLPNYDGSLEHCLSQYWDYYLDMIAILRKAYPDEVFWMDTPALNDADDIARLLEFCGYEEEHQRIQIIHEHKNG